MTGWRARDLSPTPTPTRHDADGVRAAHVAHLRRFAGDVARRPAPHAVWTLRRSCRRAIFGPRVDVVGADGPRAPERYAVGARDRTRSRSGSAPSRRRQPALVAVMPVATRRPDDQRHGDRAPGLRIRGVLRRNGLAIALLSAFLLIWLAGQTTSGLRTYNAERSAAGLTGVGFWKYLTTSHFGEATFENWESEFLQMGMFVVLTIKLRQWGSAESKPLNGATDQDEDPTSHQDDPEAPWPVRRGGPWLRIYSNSLSIAFFSLFILSFVLHAVTGSRAFNEEQVMQGSTDLVSSWSYLGRAQFWFESLQNWQSEFLAVAAIVVLTIFLRQHGSPESKPVHAPHRRAGD